MNPISRRQVLSSIGLAAGAGLWSGFGRDLHSAPQAEDVPAPDWNLYATEVDPAFEHAKHLGRFYDHTTASPDNVAQMSPCFLEANGKIYMFTNIGPRLNQKIAMAVAEPPANQRGNTK